MHDVAKWYILLITATGGYIHMYMWLAISDSTMVSTYVATTLDTCPWSNTKYHYYCHGCLGGGTTSLMFCVDEGSLGLQRCLSTSSSNHSLVTGCMMELHTPVMRQTWLQYVKLIPGNNLV